MELTLEQRIDRLEHAARRWRLACLGLLSGLTVAVVAGFAQDDAGPTEIDRLVARSIVVRDPETNAQIVLKAGPNFARLTVAGGPSHRASVTIYASETDDEAAPREAWVAAYAAGDDRARHLARIAAGDAGPSAWVGTERGTERDAALAVPAGD